MLTAWFSLSCHVASPAWLACQLPNSQDRFSHAMCWTMELTQANTDIVSALAEAAQRAVLVDTGNKLLNKAKEVAHRIEKRCRDAMRTNPNSRDRPPSGRA